MSYINVEIKAHCPDPSFIRCYLQDQKAEFKGIDEQTDTYFNVQHGRLKLRQGNIENNLIYYERSNDPQPKNSIFNLVKVEDSAGLKTVLEKSMGIKVVVNKKREIYYLQNVKFHIDEVEGLGTFVEIEAGNILVLLDQKALKDQCEYYRKEFGIQDQDLVSVSYSDMVLSERKN